MRILRGATAWLAVPVLATAMACSTNPATGRPQLDMYTEQQEIALGRRYDAQVREQVGVYDDARLQVYVERLGCALAARSERPDLPWRFAVLDDPSVNAFALPGGYVYVTRGLVERMSDEAELAGVLGHEIGHVTARHQVNEMSKRQLTHVGLMVSRLVSPEAHVLGGVADVAGGLLFLELSRHDERQADELGLRYLVRGGYPPEAMSSVFELLARVGASEPGARLPGWLQTHPDPRERLRRIQTLYRTLPPALEQASRRAEPLLARLEGTVYGDDPREGFFRDGVFVQPELGIAMDGPRGWKSTHQRAAVVWQSADRSALMALTLSTSSDARRAAEQFFAQRGVEAAGGLGLGDLRAGGGAAGGFGGAFLADTDQGAVEGTVRFVEQEGRVFRLVAMAQQDDWNRLAPEVERAMRSFRPVDAREIGAITPWTVDLVRVDRPTTLRQLALRYPSTVPLAKVAQLDGVDVDAPLRAGQVVKRVVGGVPGVAVP